VLISHLFLCRFAVSHYVDVHRRNWVRYWRRFSSFFDFTFTSCFETTTEASCELQYKSTTTQRICCTNLPSRSLSPDTIERRLRALIFLNSNEQVNDECVVAFLRFRRRPQHVLTYLLILTKTREIREVLGVVWLAEKSASWLARSGGKLQTDAKYPSVINSEHQQSTNRGYQQRQ